MPDVKLAVPTSTAEGGPGVQQIVIAPPRLQLVASDSNFLLLTSNLLFL